MVKTGCLELDNLIEGLNEEINCVYGPASSGKTTLALMASIEVAKNNGKVLFIDTENGFSVERFKQIAGEVYNKLLDRVFVLKANSFDEQSKRVKEALMLASKFDLIIVDSMSTHYRKEIHRNTQKTNRELDKQMKIFSQITRDCKVPVLLTNQVYTNVENSEKTIVGGNMMKNWSKKLIELSIEPRRLKMIKPGVKETNINIIEKGLVLV